jgi:hypothetical protein
VVGVAGDRREGPSLNAARIDRNDPRMTTQNASPRPDGGVERDELDDSWFDLPVLVEVPTPKKVRAPEDELDDSWFDRPGHGIRRSDVLGR